MEGVTATDLLAADLRRIFGTRLQSVMVYDAVAPVPTARNRTREVHTLVLVDEVNFDDIAACATHSAEWEKGGLATPLLMAATEFTRSLDAFPLEYGQILATHRVVAGADLFSGVSVNPDDVRRSCEVQAKSHLIHLREAYIEAAGQPRSIARIILASVAPFRALLASVARLRGRPGNDAHELVREAEGMGLPPAIVERVLGFNGPGDLPIREAPQIFRDYLDAVQQLARHVDEWKR